MSRKLIGAVLGVAALAAGVVVGAPAASAGSPQWNADWVAGSQPNLVQVGDVLTGSGLLIFRTLVFGVYTHIGCALPHSFITHMVSSSDVLSGDPGDVLSFDVALPAVLSSSTVGDPNYDVCEDLTHSQPIDVTTLGSSAPLTLFVGLPAHSTGDPLQFTGTVDSWLGVPDSEVTFDDPYLGTCTGPVSPYAAPWVPLPSGVSYTGGQVASGTYHTTSGTVTPDSDAFRVSQPTSPPVCFANPGWLLVPSYTDPVTSRTYTTGITLDQPLTFYWQ